MQIKTSELIGAALDWAVTQIDYEGTAHDVWRNFRNECHYSTDWKEGGPIIEREDIALNPCAAPTGWSAYKVWGDRGEYVGPTPLIAAMRCYVASKLGDSVEIPEKLA